MKLQALQKQAGKAISGGYTRVTGEAYNIKLNLLLIDLHIEITSMRSALRVVSTLTFRTPESHLPPGTPLAKLIAQIEACTGKAIANLELKRP